MPEQLSFERRFSEYGPGVRPEERTQEILNVVEDFMHRWGYSVQNLIGAELTVEHLGGGPCEVPDLIFKMAALDYFEIVIRSGGGAVSYGGWLTGTLPVTVSGQQVNGRPVLLTTGRDGGQIRHVFDPLSGYRPVTETINLPLHAVRRLSGET
ncbi:hypothetical protein [Leisingera methylohalidivorans]|uniref:Uncharacterized protein n=1 Tax=Leisingera methylohalidivorans DSM 14336 TaxID=999552 RepID=V9VWJ9_9RHOB|nr:hypothetical protein [Leisingera methylohalidivorans]AHD03141.1 hypothetical protein METH_14435 [Leisingera methylohalidivorans DSM 14336]